MGSKFVYIPLFYDKLWEINSFSSVSKLLNMNAQRDIPYTRFIALICATCINIFMAGMDFTSVAAILPAIALKYSTLVTINWVLTTYMLAQAVTLLLFRQLATLVSYKILSVVLCLFSVAGSAMSGASSGMPLLLAGRVLAGIGAAGGIAIPMAVVNHNEFSHPSNPKQLAWITHIWLNVWSIAGVIGLVVGAFLAPHESWPWVFYLQIPGSVLGTALCFPVVPHRQDKSAGTWQMLRQMDILGTLFLVGSVVTFILALNLGGNILAWGSGAIITLLVVAFVLFILVIVVELKVAKFPVLPLKLAYTPSAAAILAMQPLLGIVVYGSIAYLIMWFSVIQHHSLRDCGLYLLPAVAISAAMTIASSIFWRKPAWKIYLSCSMLTLGSGLLIIYKANIDKSGLMALTIPLGIGMGLSLQPFVASLWKSAEPRGDLSSIVESVLALRLLGGTVAIALYSAILQHCLLTNLALVALQHPFFSVYIMESPKNQDIVRLPQLPQSVKSAIRDVNVEGFQHIFIAGVVFATVTLPLCFFVRNKSTAQDDSSHHELSET